MMEKSPGGRTRVAVVGPHDLVSAGLECLMNSDEQIAAFEGGTTPTEALEILSSTDVEIVVYYASTPATHGPDLIGEVRNAGHAVRFIAVVDAGDGALARACLGAGADACLATTSKPEDLIAAVRACRDGQTFVSAEIDQSIAEDPIYSRLTPRERDVLRLIASGSTSQEAADQLGIAYKTVDSHRQSITKKLESKNVADLVRMAIRARLVDAS